MGEVSVRIPAHIADRMLVNGRESFAVPPGDRGFLYGEGVFETIAVHNARPLNLDHHLARLSRGCERLFIPPPNTERISAEAYRLVGGHECAVLKIMVTGGEGDRGYAPPKKRSPNRFLRLFPWPHGIKRFDRAGVAVKVCETRLAINPRLAGIKHLNRLEQVLAGAELDAAYGEGIVLDFEGNAVEGTSANLMLISSGALLTPDLSRCGIEGVMRELVLETALRLDIPTQVRTVSLDEVMEAESLFFTNVVRGIQPVVRAEERHFKIHPWIDALQEAVQGFEISNDR